MWNNSILICGLLYLAGVDAYGGFDDESSVLNLDVQRIKPRNWERNDEKKREENLKIEWRGNGNFLHSRLPELQSNAEPGLANWDPQFERHIEKEADSIDIERSPPPAVLLPPFEFYSASINNFANEESTTVAFEPFDENHSLRNRPTIKTLRIYEITKSNKSLESPRDNEKTTERSFTISDPSLESNSIDSLRSVIKLNKNSITRLESGKDDGRTNGPSDRSPGINVIRANSVKGNAPRGNRKYQTRVDSDERAVRRNSWRIDQRYQWRKRRPTNYSNFFSDSMRLGRVPHDYPVNKLRTATLGRFPCPTNPVKHFYLADRASRCQIFYVCYGSEIGVPMVCPNGTLFNQEIQVCDWWFNVNC